ncbi:DUF5954 family protein [Streptomyces sp. NPDC048331]|uniref:DUF5954 family protein n=1 Tax=Streptomyces sp. NPDC048331 TaxID=3365534 RepID=UPI003720820E
MDRGDMRPRGSRPVVVRVPVEPVEAAREADALDAVARAGDVVVRGPLFGVAAQAPGDGPRWRVVLEVTAGCPQQARDGLNSRLWFRAKDEARDRAERRPDPPLVALGGPTGRRAHVRPMSTARSPPGSISRSTRTGTSCRTTDP